MIWLCICSLKPHPSVMKPVSGKMWFVPTLITLCGQRATCYTHILSTFFFVANTSRLHERRADKRGHWKQVAFVTEKQMPVLYQHKNIKFNLQWQFTFPPVVHIEQNIHKYNLKVLSSTVTKGFLKLYLSYRLLNIHKSMLYIYLYTHIWRCLYSEIWGENIFQSLELYFPILEIKIEPFHFKMERSLLASIMHRSVAGTDYAHRITYYEGLPAPPSYSRGHRGLGCVN